MEEEIAFSSLGDSKRWSMLECMDACKYSRERGALILHGSKDTLKMSP